MQFEEKSADSQSFIGDQSGVLEHELRDNEQIGQPEDGALGSGALKFNVINEPNEAEKEEPIVTIKCMLRPPTLEGNPKKMFPFGGRVRLHNSSMTFVPKSTGQRAYEDHKHLFEI